MSVKFDNEIKYISAFPDTSNWTLSDWNLCLLLNVYNKNVNHTDSLLHNKMWSQDKKLNLLYQIIILVHAAFTLLRVTCAASGGYSLLCLTAEEI